MNPSPSKQRLSDYPILFFSLMRHDGEYFSAPWQVSSVLARTNRVIYVDHPYTFLDAVTKFMKRAVRKRIQSYTGNYFFLKDGVEVVLPPFIWPVSWLPKGKIYDFFYEWNHRLVANRINRFLKSSNIESIVYVNSDNYHFPTLHKRLLPDVTLKVCYRTNEKLISEPATSNCQELADDVDVTISTSRVLQNNFRDSEKNFLLPFGCNSRAYCAIDGVEVHPDIAHMKGKVLGYLGNIDHTIDYKLLLQIIQLIPDWTLVLAGEIDHRYIPRELREHHRVRFLGPIAPHDEPAVVKRFDVAMLPIITDKANRDCYPARLLNYLAAGKPVVTTNCNPEALGEFRNVINIANSAVEFSDRVLLSYATDSSEKKAARMAVASQHTWEQRAHVFTKILNHELDFKAAHEQPVTAQMKTSVTMKSWKEKLLSNPDYKKFILSRTTKRKPYDAAVKWYVWLGYILPKYFKKGISWSSHLSITPFNKFSLGKYSCIDHGAVINNVMGDVIIKDEVHIGIGSVIIGPVTLHDHVELSPYVRVMGMHQGNDADSPHYTQPHTVAPVIMEENVWVGTGTVIMGKKNGQPLVLGKYCRIGANSIVIDDVPPYSIAVGSPARVVRVWDFDNNCWVKPKTKECTPEVNISEVASYIAEVTDYIAIASSYIPPQPKEKEEKIDENVKLAG